ncbi:TPA: hypothetical protein ACOGEA_002711 [Staphylococcus aureus]
MNINQLKVQRKKLPEEVIINFKDEDFYEIYKIFLEHFFYLIDKSQLNNQISLNELMNDFFFTAKKY